MTLVILRITKLKNQNNNNYRGGTFCIKDKKKKLYYFHMKKITFL